MRIFVTAVYTPIFSTVITQYLSNKEAAFFITVIRRGPNFLLAAKSNIAVFLQIVFLGALTKFRKSTIRFVMSVRLSVSVRLEQLGYH
jgi:hypothetical protein